MCSNCCCSCSFEPEIIKIGQSSHKMSSNNLLNFQESTIILNAGTKKSGNLLKAIVDEHIKKPLKNKKCFPTNPTKNVKTYHILKQI